MHIDWLMALWGGVLIGIAVSLMLLWNGRVTGISGIISSAMTLQKGDRAWRWSFLLGLLGGGLTLKLLRPELFGATVTSSVWLIAIAGLLVGFGTVMGSGCTSGHGVCGISRMSVRSLLATFTFIAAGVLTVALLRGGGVLV